VKVWRESKKFVKSFRMERGDGRSGMDLGRPGGYNICFDVRKSGSKFTVGLHIKD